ncbi:FKBP-type peptidyl-prolyl cis-trans isomerase [Fulvivirga sedimenti]|uniref:Peptidyl-prolyl cis-trans isomerase n=1 Tax=Fulvivirga sedimenti TaxID=2879465 RepID=A0A9X1L1E1_9BACT|nr:FKBP-type peptidyl-prolyl cis-trans isomerase [Fulvivirga sedimenti]MCA6078137.1 FKBP-type peptidyl-prolyl cis-trans isomerase [Fulvivirga sedimenti]
MMFKKGVRVVTGLLMTLTLFMSSCNDDDGTLSVQDQFKFENEKIDAYIANKGLATETDPNSALRYRVINPGTGIQPWAADSITASYTVSLLDTEETVEVVTNAKIPYNELILGVRYGLHFVQEGGSIQFFVPSPYAYGTVGNGGNIPANATLIYNFQLHEVHAQQLRADIATIDTYLEDNNLGAIKHPSGLRYNVVNAGTGNHPNLFSVIIVNYEGRLLSNGAVFDGRENVGFLLGDLITGWHIGLPQIKAGGEIIMYIPSSLGFGPTGAPPDIPQNANLIFDVDLIGVQ